MQPFTKTLAVLSGAMSFVLLTGCAGMTQQEKATTIGAGAGAIGGSILRNGFPPRT